jgi:hypothetical protein
MEAGPCLEREPISDPHNYPHRVTSLRAEAWPGTAPVSHPVRHQGGTVLSVLGCVALRRGKRKAARRRLLNSSLMILDQEAINAGFAFRRSHEANACEAKEEHRLSCGFVLRECSEERYRTNNIRYTARRTNETC